MKKILIIAFLSMVFLGCKTINIYHEVEAQAALARFIMDNTLDIVEFDGKQVSWNAKWRGRVVNCQPGAHTLLANYSTSSQYNSWWSNGLKITYDFEAGKNYLIRSEVIRNTVHLEIDEVTDNNRHRYFARYFK